MTGVAKKLVKGSALRMITLVANILIGFFMMPFLIHSLGDEQYGIWVLVGAIVGFYGLLDAGFGGAIVRFVVRAMHGDSGDTDKEVNIALSSAVFLFSGIGVLSLLVTGILIALVPSFVDSEVNQSLSQVLIGILGFKASVLFPMMSFSGVLMAKYRFDLLSYIRLFSLVFRTSLIVIFINNGFDIVAVAIITSIDALLVSLNTVYFAKKVHPSLRISLSYLSKKKLKKYFDYGKYTYVTTIADRVRFSIDDIVVASFISVGAVTHYTIAVALITYFGEAMGSMFGVIAPALNKFHKLGQWDKLKEVFFVTTEFSAMFSILSGGLLIVLGEPFIEIWMGKDYADVYMVLLILCIASIIAHAQRPSVAILYAIAKHKYYAKITSIEAVVNIALSITLVQFIGIYGVAFGTAIPMLFNKLLLQPVYTCKQLDVSLKDYFYNIFKYFLVGVLLFLPAIYIKGFIELDSYFRLILAGFVLSVIYVVVNLKFVLSGKGREYLINVAPVRYKGFIRLMS